MLPLGVLDRRFLDVGGLLLLLLLLLPSRLLLLTRRLRGMLQLIHQGVVGVLLIDEGEKNVDIGLRLLVDEEDQLFPLAFLRHKQLEFPTLSIFLLAGRQDLTWGLESLLLAGSSCEGEKQSEFRLQWTEAQIKSH